MKHRISDLLQVFAAVLLTGGLLVSAAPLPPKEAITAPVEVVQEASAIETQVEPIKAPEPIKIEPEAPKKVDWRTNPNKCDTDTQWIYEDASCHDKPKTVEKSASPVATSRPVVSAGSGSCASEIAKYSWDQSTALAVARAESGLNPGALNNNPATRDYSVGCFQINIYGANARSRPSEAALKNAATNVAFAYKIYSGNGSSFIGQWGVCRHIHCY